MSGVRVSIGDLRAAGRRIGEVSDVVRSADLSGDVVAVAQALPGSVSAEAARGLGRAWSSRVRGIARTAGKHEQRFGDSADAYAASDERAVQVLRSLQPELRDGVVVRHPSGVFPTRPLFPKR